MRVVGIIPARMASSRFPGKPLADIHGMPMIGHCWHRCKLSDALEEVYIATCDETVKAYAKAIGAPCIMTSDKHERATDRCAEAMLKIEQAGAQRTDIMVMIQGDEPMVHPAMMLEAIGPLLDDPSVNVVNLYADLGTDDEFDDANEVKVVIDLGGNALYFSREPIPSRRKGTSQVPMLKQVCVIPFRRDYLLRFNELPATPLEVIESVDMMRILEHGEKVRMVRTEFKSLSVDTPGDLARVAEMMRHDSLMKSYL